MAQFLKLSGFIVNLDYIEKILFDPAVPAATIFWSSGYEETTVYGESALLLMDVLDRYSVDNYDIPAPKVK